MKTISRLLIFAVWVMSKSHTTGRAEGLAADDLHTKLAELDLLQKVNVVKPCGARCLCAASGNFPTQCFQLEPSVAGFLRTFKQEELTFLSALEQLLIHCDKHKESDTPSRVLAQHLNACLENLSGFAHNRDLEFSRLEDEAERAYLDAACYEVAVTPHDSERYR
jgi:hypothetical protein